MDEAAIIQYLTDTCPGMQVTNADGNYFFFYDPEQKFPFATLVTRDDYDTASNLSRPGVFRLNIGVSKQTFQGLFGLQSPDAGHDFTALDRVMPHPVYGSMYWVCVLSPSAKTFETVRPLLAEAYDAAVAKQAKRQSRESPGGAGG